MATWPATLCEMVPGDALGHKVKPNAAHDTVEAAAATAVTATGGLHAEQHSSLVTLGFGIKHQQTWKCSRQTMRHTWGPNFSVLSPYWQQQQKVARQPVGIQQ